MLRKSDFGEKFIWGAGTAAYQVEGGTAAGLKGKSIWDVFVKRKNRILKNQNGDIACDFYNRYPSDLSLMSSLNILNHRFSVSWTRILPDGTGSINQVGIDFYNRLIDLSLELGITPWLTLYHWDLPYELEKKGGWTNRDVITWFEDYAAVCVKHFGDRVNNWIILNEPIAFTGVGYFMGMHAPGRRGLNNFLAAVHHAALTQAIGAGIIKSLLRDSNVGTTFSGTYIEPFSNSEPDRTAAKTADVLLNRLFIEPLLGLGYPAKELGFIKPIEKYMKAGDEKKLAFKMDFVGLQNYTREIVRRAVWVPYVKAKIVKADKRNVETTVMNREVHPEAIYHLLKRYSAYKNIPDIMITENGAPFKDLIKDGKVDDPQRIKFLKSNMEQVLRAMQEGVNVTGYFVWSFLDNFEWTAGYDPRFGLVYVDFETQKRTVKSSGWWYADFLK